MKMMYQVDQRKTYQMTDILELRHELDGWGNHRLVAVHAPGGQLATGPFQIEGEWVSYTSTAQVRDAWHQLYEAQTAHLSERVAAVNPLRAIR